YVSYLFRSMSRADFFVPSAKCISWDDEKLRRFPTFPYVKYINLWCLQNFALPNSAAARHNVKIPVGFSRFCTRLAEFFAVLVEISTSTADFCGCEEWFLRYFGVL
ncbi:MAG: hypothetical protein IIW85_05625, partial [Bacteroidaceae bacterium]|nr:hypothetical protein [Bacteroidaceae bacterium]